MNNRNIFRDPFNNDSSGNVIVMFIFLILILIINIYGKLNLQYNVNNYQYECHLYNIIELCPDLTLYGYINRTDDILIFKFIDYYNNDNCKDDYDNYIKNNKFNCWISDDKVYTKNKLDSEINFYNFIIWGIVAILLCCVSIISIVIGILCKN